MPIIQHLLVDQFGSFVSKYSERLKVMKGKEMLAQAPLMHLESLTIANQGVSLSAEVVRECTERGIPIHFISGTGTAYASLYSAGLAGTVATRRAQLLAYTSTRGLFLAMAFSAGKLQNQANLLKYMGKYRKETDPPLYEELRLRAAEVVDAIIDIERMRHYPEVVSGEATIEDLREEMMGLEGRAGRQYWGAIKQALPETYGFTARTGRGARDPVNSALNYGYGILYHLCERCLTLAGLDPYAGFLHADRPGKPSLALDFIEEFRQPIVDRTVIGMANKNVAFEQEENGLLTKDFRRTLAEKINTRLDAPAPFEGKKYPLRVIMQMQARHVATYLRHERTEYTAFTMGW
ncbi:MAG: CRISPR-associated endonuclease Cas1 [Anaerolineales bacterium]|nr:CRISPR-associated endonuclease Cas1 [Anaerolineales bacterium]